MCIRDRIVIVAIALYARYLAQLLHVVAVSGRVADEEHGLIGPEGREYLYFKTAVLDSLMVFQRIGGIIGSADDAHVHFQQQAPDTVLGLSLIHI